MSSVMLYPCMFCVALLMDLFVLYVACLTVFVNCFVKQFAISLGLFAILLLNVMDLLLEVLYWRDHVWFSKECVGCACNCCVFCFWYVVLVCHQYDVCENSVGSVYIDGYV